MSQQELIVPALMHRLVTLRAQTPTFMYGASMQIQLEYGAQPQPAANGSRLSPMPWLTELTRRCLTPAPKGQSVLEPIADSVAWEDTEIDVRRLVL